MNISSEDRKQLTELEESLWQSKTRFNKVFMENVLAPDFVEFGRSGRIYSRHLSINAPYQEFDAVLPLKDLAIHSVSSDAVLITYVSKAEFNDKTETANRSSIWVRYSDRWKLKFHQGTPTE